MFKVVICGAGFIGSNIARALLAAQPVQSLQRHVQIASRRPQKLHDHLRSTPGASERLLDPATLDITKPDTLRPALNDASIVVSLVGLLSGTPQQFKEIQWLGAENVARVCRDNGAKLIHVSAIGADPSSTIPYAQTKGSAEKAVLDLCPDATIIRPSVVFGPGDGLFSRFAKLSKFLPFLPVFGGGQTRFQPVFVGDIGRSVEIMTRNDESINKSVAGKIVEAGGPDVLTYREMMELVLKSTHRRRPIVSLPFALGMAQAAIFERLPTSVLSITRDQVRQLKLDNVVNPNPGPNYVSFKDLVERHSSGPLKSVHDVLPTYLS